MTWSINVKWATTQLMKNPTFYRYEYVLAHITPIEYKTEANTCSFWCHMFGRNWKEEKAKTLVDTYRVPLSPPSQQGTSCRLSNLIADDEHTETHPSEPKAKQKLATINCESPKVRLTSNIQRKINRAATERKNYCLAIEWKNNRAANWANMQRSKQTNKTSGNRI